MRIKLHHELKELLSHLAEMSGNAAKLCLFLNLNDREMGVDDDLARECGWSLSTLKRAVRELRASHIVEGFKSDHAKVCQVKSDPAPKTVEVKSDPNSQESGVKSDPEPVPYVPPGIKDDPVEAAGARIVRPSEGFEIPAGCRFTDELSPASKDLLEFVGFACDRRFLSRGFIVIVEKFAKRRPWERPGMLASCIIERCLYWQRKRRAAGENPALYFFPPGFQKWRDSLRRQERLAGKAERQARAA